jgi:hypothetical protein
VLNGNPYQNHSVFGKPSPQLAALYRARKHAMASEARLTEEEAELEAAKYGGGNFAPAGAARVAPPQQSALGGDWMGAASRNLGSLASNATGLIGMFRGQGASPLPSWSSSFRMPSVSPTLTAAAVAPSAYNPSGTFNQPWTFPSSLGGG